MAEDDDLLAFTDEDGAQPAALGGTPWKVAIIDDDPAVHFGTRFALADYSLHGQGLELVSAHSAAEGRKLLSEHADTAVVLLDVVMESDNAGLELVDFIRKKLRNETVRIILRTGQPGQAPERRIIVDYDINDYKAKTELTADKLFTALTSAIRSHQQLQRMVETRRGLELIIDAAAELFDLKSIERLAEGTLMQIGSLLKTSCAGILVLRECGHARDDFTVLAGTGVYGPSGAACLTGELRELVARAFERKSNEFLDQHSVLYVKTASDRELVAVVEADKMLTETDRALIMVFCSRLSVAFDNVILYGQLQEVNRTLEARVVERTRELQGTNARLAASSAQLRRTNAYKNQLLGKVAHDLKNPLGVILGRTEILGELLAHTPDAVEHSTLQITHIRDAAKHLLAMVDILIADAMADADDITIRRDMVDVAALAREVVDANRPLADKKHQLLIMDAVPELFVSGDHDRLREAIDNVVSNAIKYTPSKGTIRVIIKARHEEAIIAVSDSGPGLSPEDRARLFGRFQRLSAKPTGGESSTGLGLSIAKKIVDLHGGQISAESRGIGLGTTFTIELPLDSPARKP